MMCLSSLRQLGLLLWKNLLLQRRKWVISLLELLIPVFFSLLLLVLRNIITIKQFDAPTTWPAFSIDTLPPKLESFSGPWKLAFTPNTSLSKSIIDGVINASQKRISGGYGYSTEDEMIKNIVNLYDTYIGGIVFSSFPKNNVENSSKITKNNVVYKIRLPYYPRNTQYPTGGSASETSWQTQYTFPVFQLIGPREENNTRGGMPGYYREGFLTLQYLIDHAIINHLSPSSKDKLELNMQRIPYPPYVKDNFILVLQTQLSFFLLLSFIFSALNITKNVVHEKEKKLKETMKMMGLQSWLHWTAWFINYFIILGIAVVMIVGICKIDLPSHGRVLAYSDPSVIIFLLLMYSCAVIFSCFAISVFFNTARAGAAAGGLLFLFSYIPYSFIQPRYATVSIGLKIFSCILPNTAMALACQMIGMFEGTGEGLQWNNLGRGSSVDETFTPLHIILMLLTDCILFMIIAWYKETVAPGNYGIPLPWYFLFTSSYWCGTPRKTNSSLETGVSTTNFVLDANLNNNNHNASVEISGSTGAGNPNIEQDPKNLTCTVNIVGLIKEFGKGANKKVAVNDISINFYKGQITAILGHNGAGKTTTMSMIAGFIPPTDGHIFINGLDIQYNISTVRRKLGLCPQHDILFDEMTVEEHLTFFAKLKNYPREMIRADIDRLIEATHLEDKRHAFAKTLSGGMKRKLSVAIALVGGSEIVILDEPTSGMDPSARRELWTFLQAERSHRTMLLSTHFMDEADFLGDRIAIMASGKFQCCGSSLFLKSRYGAGYHLTMVKSPNCQTRDILNLIRSKVPEAKIESNIGDELSVILPSEASKHFEELFTELESNRHELGIASYGASVTTMEEVYLKVGELDAAMCEIREDHQEPQRLAVGLDENSMSSTTNLIGATCEDYMASRNTGCRLKIQQFWAIFLKRVIHSRRNLIITISQLIVPIFFTVIGLMILKTVPGLSNSPPLTLDLSKFQSQVITYGQSENTSVSILQAYINQFNSRALTTTRNLSSTNFFNDSTMEKAYINIAKDKIDLFNRQYIIGGYFGSQSNREATIAFFNDQAYHSPAISLNAFSNAILKSLKGNSYTITTINAPQPLTDIDKTKDKTLDFAGFSTAINVVFGLAFLASSFSVFVVKERANKVKHLHFVAGTNMFSYWFGTLAWDFINYLVPCCGLIIVFASFQEAAFSSTAGRIGGIFLLLFLYGWSVIPQMYICSYIFKVPSTALVWLSSSNFVTGLATLLAVNVLKIPQLNLESTADLLKIIFTILFPNFCLGQAISDYYTNYVYTSTCGTEQIQYLCKLLKLKMPCCKETCSPLCADWTPYYLGFEPGGIGLSLIALFGQGIINLAICLFIESSFFSHLKNIFNPNRRHVVSDSHRLDSTYGATNNWVKEDTDVAKERARLASTSINELVNTNSMIIKEFTHYYGSHCAVDRISCGIAPGECFGLLGVNGAGKTTTFKMLTGDLQITAGDAYINGFSVSKSLRQVQRNLGYCPQFDGLIDHLTGRETLYLFARLRGLRESLISTEVNYLLSALLLEQYADCLTSTYSGGNKRKLSTAMALVGGPSVVCLDEPTTGMDPVARRHLWRAVANYRERGHTLILTSHSMEECEALCTKIAIMVNGQFKCYGSCQHLKAKFGSGYSLLVQVPYTEASGDEYVTNLKDFVETHFSSAELLDVHQGVLHYHLHPSEDVTWARVFGVFERNKDSLNLENYAVSQTTLEQVFISFAQSQIPPNETKTTCFGAIKRCLCCQGD